MDSKVELLEDKSVDIIYFVKQGETLTSIADKFKTTVDIIVEDNQLSEVSEGDILWIRNRNSMVYIVRPADTLSTVALKCNVTEQHIRELNKLQTDALYVGQKLIL